MIIYRGYLIYIKYFFCQNRFILLTVEKYFGTIGLKLKKSHLDAFPGVKFNILNQRNKSTVLKHLLIPENRNV